MRIAKLLPTVAGVTVAAMCGAARADFQTTAVKTDRGADDVIDVYFHNDGLNNTGTALEAYEVRYQGTPTQFYAYFDAESETNAVSIYNGPNNPAHSWFRVHPLRRTPFRLIPDRESTAWQSPIGDFTVTYATFELVPEPANFQPGYHFARIVIPDGGEFTLNGQVGGEVGGAALVSMSHRYFTENVPPVISNPTGKSAPATSMLVRANDADGLITSFTATDLDGAATRGVTLQRIGDDYSLDWSQALPGNYRFQFDARDSSIQSNGSATRTFSVAVVPEPTTLLASLAAAGLSLGRNRRRSR